MALAQRLARSLSQQRPRLHRPIIFHVQLDQLLGDRRAASHFPRDRPEINGGVGREDDPSRERAPLAIADEKAAQAGGVLVFEGGAPVPGEDGGDPGPVAALDSRVPVGWCALARSGSLHQPHRQGRIAEAAEDTAGDVASAGQCRFRITHPRRTDSSLAPLGTPPSALGTKSRTPSQTPLVDPGGAGR